ncbi:hypothetical protein [Levilactobacillus wangkuiensis]|uniref:hypothetical protein n=1 Tax=Levilactobacillus wangkuiensis TaxID=2799566 RepID=UPI0019505A77|nr:hypothetical protein [Levilactobacillus wangkuiensis]
MRIKLKKTADTSIYAPGNVIWNSEHDTFFMVVHLFKSNPISESFFLIDLDDGNVVADSRRSSLKELAKDYCSVDDHLIVDPTIVEGGAEG